MAEKRTNPYKQPAFLICASLLAFACVTQKAVLVATGRVLKKIPIDLRKPFDDIDKEKLAPYKVVSEAKIKNKDVEDELGTKDYIQWILEDTEVSQISPVRYCSLFLTYYGKADRVPHVPDKCYGGSGYDIIDARHDLLYVKSIEDSFEMRVLTLRSKNADIILSDPDFLKMYFFKVNNDYKCTRNGVRTSLNKNITGKHSFYAKIEWEFYGAGIFGKSRPSAEQNAAASEKLISKLLPVLENEHWPIIDETDGDEVSETENNVVLKEETTPKGLKK